MRFFKATFLMNLKMTMMFLFDHFIKYVRFFGEVLFEFNVLLVIASILLRKKHTGSAQILPVMVHKNYREMHNS
jgi:hypothetical protein